MCAAISKQLNTIFLTVTYFFTETHSRKNRFLYKERSNEQQWFCWIHLKVFPHSPEPEVHYCANILTITLKLRNIFKNETCHPYHYPRLCRRFCPHGIEG